MVAAAMSIATSAAAQTTHSGYFVEDYTYRFQMNPAYNNSKNFISIPALANINVGVNGNLNLDNILYNINGKTTTFLNPNVSAAEFLGNLEDVNKLRTGLKIDLLAIGFKGLGGYNTISVSARANIGANIPKSIFSLVKEGVANQSYDISDFHAKATSYAEIALGHSHQIGSDWRIGATLKVLLGAGNVDANLRNAQLTLGQDTWSVTTDAEVNANIKGLYFKHEINENTQHQYVNDVDIDGGGIGGFGMAVDLGAIYNPKSLSDWTFSVAVLDLGFINWSNNMLATTDGVKSFSTDKYTFNFDKDSDNYLEDEFDKIKDDLSALYELEDKGDQGSITTTLAATVNAGVEYTFPLYRKLKFGLLNSTRINGDYSYTDFRLSANYAPCGWFDGSVNVNTGTFGTGFGWLINLHATGFNLFAGMDNILSKVSKQFVPLKSNASVNFGMNILF